MNWIKLEDAMQLETISKESANEPILIFKHSTRCSVSAMALHRLESQATNNNTRGIISYYLDLLRFRAISDRLAEQYHVQHQSPQVLLIKNDKCVYNASHLDINWNKILDSTRATV